MLSAFAFKDGSIYTIAAIPRIGPNGVSARGTQQAYSIYVSKREIVPRVVRLERVVCFSPNLVPRARYSAEGEQLRGLIWGGEHVKRHRSVVYNCQLSFFLYSNQR